MPSKISPDDVLAKLAIRPGTQAHRELLAAMLLPVPGSDAIARHSLLMGTMFGRWLFKPASLQRDIAVQASGNLIAAYFILVAVCFVGLGDYTANIRYWVIVLSLSVAGAGLVVGILTYVRHQVIEAARKHFDGSKLTSRGETYLRTGRDVVVFLTTVLAIGAFVGLIYLLEQPIANLVGKTP